MNRDPTDANVRIKLPGSIKHRVGCASLQWLSSHAEFRLSCMKVCCGS